MIKNFSEFINTQLNTNEYNDYQDDKEWEDFYIDDIGDDFVKLKNNKTVAHFKKWIGDLAKSSGIRVKMPDEYYNSLLTYVEKELGYKLK